jgi:Protein of unknown function (DUF1566)
MCRKTNGCILLSILLVVLFESVSVANDVVYKDIETGLMWQIEDNGDDLSWAAAKDYCEQLTSGGFTDWRVPTQDELATLYRLEAAETSEYYILQKIKISACCQWASDIKGSKVASFDFEYGNKDWRHPMSTVETRVVAVRNIK